MANSKSIDETQLRAVISKIRNQKSTIPSSPAPPSGSHATGDSPAPYDISAIVELTGAQIWATPAGMLVDSGTDSTHNWAKIKLQENSNVSDAVADVAFYFYFSNPSHDYVSVLGQVETNISARGTVDIEADSGTFDLGHTKVWVDGLFNMYTPFVGNTYSWGAAPVSIGYKNADGGENLYLGSNDYQRLTCDGTSHSLVWPNNIELAGGADALFEVQLRVSYTIDEGGYINVDFNSNDFEVGCTEVKFNILTDNRRVIGAQHTPGRNNTVH